MNSRQTITNFDKLYQTRVITPQLGLDTHRGIQVAEVYDTEYDGLVPVEFVEKYHGGVELKHKPAGGTLYVRYVKPLKKA
jgi:hypothetical protein